MAEKPRTNRPPSDKLRARLPRGFADRDAADIRAVEAMLAKIRAVYERYGFTPVETPFLEYTDALGKFLPDQDRPNEGVFSLKDDDGQWLSLRYDLTAPLARFVAQNYNDLPRPYRSYRSGWVFRNEKPGPGRFRQFMQSDADIVGSSSPAADAEMAMMMADVMEAVGIRRGDYVIRVNNRKVLDGVMEVIGIGGPEHEATRLTVLRAIDKFDRLGWEGVRQLLGEGRVDESGDYARGAGLNNEQADTIFQAFFRDDWSNPHTTTPEAEADTIDDDVRSEFGKGPRYDNLYFLKLLRGKMDSQGIFDAGLAQLMAIEQFVRTVGYGTRRIQINPSVVRGLEYYTGPVFEADLTFETVNEKGEKAIFGSVGGGGRYDGLVGRFRGEAVPATGFSIGVSRLAAALKNLGRLDGEAATGPVVVTVMDKGRMADYQRLAAMLREGLNAGEGPPVPVELFLGNPKNFGKQLQYADRRNAPCAVIQGSDEAARGVVQVKDMIEGRRQAEALASHQKWREQRPGQFEVPESDLVAEVRKLLERQGSG